ncbi:hypothetical protein TGRUB_271260 [Toxoplasma gondii RUB]|uniref:Uncharacterized protein n=1 Tax=Toxoplasma gondii RUB TaxID=935652 RepID=A0A086LYH7_TOXGO|nr:hypothetical protein TGRUB_271260 [Toxoplasma gondii RUB]
MPRRPKTAAALAVSACSVEDGSKLSSLTRLPPPNEDSHRGCDSRSTAQGEALENRQVEMPIEICPPHLWGLKRGRGEVPVHGAVLKVVDGVQVSKRRSISRNHVASSVRVAKHEQEAEASPVVVDGVYHHGTRQDAKPSQISRADQSTGETDTAWTGGKEEARAVDPQSKRPGTVGDGRETLRFGPGTLVQPWRPVCASPESQESSESCQGEKSEQRAAAFPITPVSRLVSPQSAFPAVTTLADECYFTSGGEETLADHCCTSQLFVTPQWSDNSQELSHPSPPEAAAETQKSIYNLDSHMCAVTADETHASPWVSPRDAMISPTITGDDDVTAAVDAARAATAALLSDLHTGLTPRSSASACGVDMEPVTGNCMPGASPVHGSSFASGTSCSMVSRKARKGGNKKGDISMAAAAGPLFVCGVAGGKSACSEMYYLRNPAFCSHPVNRLSTGSTSSVDSIASEGCPCRVRGCVHGQHCAGRFGDFDEHNQYPIVLQQSYLASAVAAGEANCVRPRMSLRRKNGKEEQKPKASPVCQKGGRGAGTHHGNKSTMQSFLAETPKPGSGTRCRPGRRSIAAKPRGDENSRGISGKLASAKNQKAQQERRIIVERILMTAEEEKISQWWRDNEAGDKLEGEESEEEDDYF